MVPSPMLALSIEGFRPRCLLLYPERSRRARPIPIHVILTAPSAAEGSDPVGKDLLFFPLSPLEPQVTNHQPLPRPTLFHQSRVTSHKSLSALPSALPKKPGRGSPWHRLQSVLPAHLPRVSAQHAGIRAIPFRSWVYFITCGHPRGWGGASASLPCATSAHSVYPDRVGAPAFTRAARGVILTLGCALPKFVIPSEAEGSASSSPAYVPLLTSLPHYLVISFLRSFTGHRPRNTSRLCHRRNAAKMNHSSSPHGHTV